MEAKLPCRGSKVNPSLCYLRKRPRPATGPPFTPCPFSLNLSPDSQKAGLRPHLDIPHELRQVEVPLLPEAGELQEEAHSVVRLLQARQTLHRPHSVEALGGHREGWGDSALPGLLQPSRRKGSLWPTNAEATA